LRLVLSKGINRVGVSLKTETDSVFETLFFSIYLGFQVMDKIHKSIDTNSSRFQEKFLVFVSMFIPGKCLMKEKLFSFTSLLVIAVNITNMLLIKFHIFICICIIYATIQGKEWNALPANRVTGECLC
jgi:hypothetical protein